MQINEDKNFIKNLKRRTFKIYNIYLINCKFYIESDSSKQIGMYNFSLSLLSYRNSFEFCSNVIIRTLNDYSLYNDYTFSLFKAFCLWDLMLLLKNRDNLALQ